MFAISLYLTILVIIHWPLDLPQGHLLGSGSLRRGGVLVEPGWMALIEWGMWGENWRSWSGHGIHRLREVVGVEAPEASGPDCTGGTVPHASPSNVRGEGVELGAGDRGG
jgi:hypothetical protein